MADGGKGNSEIATAPDKVADGDADAGNLKAKMWMTIRPTEETMLMMRRKMKTKKAMMENMYLVTKIIRK